jgi:ABC-type nitrate/sulfonate/bicarbonate transport system substrate-binding protein
MQNHLPSLTKMLGAALMIIGLSLGPASGQSPLRKVQVLLDWKAGTTFAGLYLAKELGFYSKRGLEVELVEGSGANVSAQVIGAGTSYFIGTGSGEAVAIARSKGIPVRSVAVIYPNLPTVLVSRADTPIRRPEDLPGKRVGIISGSITLDEYRGLLSANHIDRSKIQETDVGFEVTPLLRKQVDATMDYAELSPVELKLEGYDIVLLRFADFGLKAYSLNLMVNENAAVQEQEAIRSVVEGTIEGYEYLRNNPAEAAAIFSRLFPERKKEFVQESMKVVAQLLGNGPVGRQTRKGWTDTVEMLQSMGLLARAVTVDELVVKAYLQAD